MKSKASIEKIRAILLSNSTEKAEPKPSQQPMVLNGSFVFANNYYVNHYQPDCAQDLKKQ